MEKLYLLIIYLYTGARFRFVSLKLWLNAYIFFVLETLYLREIFLCQVHFKNSCVNSVTSDCSYNALMNISYYDVTLTLCLHYFLMLIASNVNWFSQSCGLSYTATRARWMWCFHVSLLFTLRLDLVGRSLYELLNYSSLITSVGLCTYVRLSKWKAIQRQMY